MPRSPEAILDPVPARSDRSDAAEARLTVLSGPSGVGKDAVLAAVRRRHPDVWVSTSVTTRAPRPTETDGIEYHFVSRDRMAELIDAGELLEHADYAGNLYGTPRRPVLERLANGRPAFLVIELQGMRQVRKLMPDAQFVFLAPPSFDELLERTTSKYALVIYAAKRARQINAYYSQLGEGLLEYVGPLVDTQPQEKPLSIALREINSGLLTHESGAE